jgi:hypothetical protein
MTPRRQAGEKSMRTEALKIMRIVAFLLFAVASVAVVAYLPGSFLALIIPGLPLFVGAVLSIVISHRQGWTIAKRAEWFENTFGRTGEDKKRGLE